MNDFKPSKDAFKVYKPKYHEEVERNLYHQSAKQRVWHDFTHNRSTIFGSVLLLILIVFMVITFFLSPYQVSDMDKTYANMKPNSTVLSKLGIWDGSYEQKVNEKRYYQLQSIAKETDNLYSPIKKIKAEINEEKKLYRHIVIDSYLEVGFETLYVTKSEYNNIKAYEQLSGLQILYPLIDENHPYASNDPDCSYYVNQNYPCDENGNFIDDNTNEILDSPKRANLRLITNYQYENNQPVYYEELQGSLKVRVLYYPYYSYKQYQNKGIIYSEPAFLFGSDTMGYDICVRLACAIGVSLLLALLVFLMNFVIGTIYGALEGYYGGIVDLILKRISEIIYEIPFFILASLFQIYLVASGKVNPFLGLFFAFCISGWISIANTTRHQIYRFKNRDYVHASRMLGGSDFHILKRHIYPNAIGTIITNTILSIPGVIFSETSLTFLGVVDLNGASFTTLGAMLANGQECLSTSPHVLFFPALAIAFLMVGFNLIGNGLREATAPNYKGENKI